MFTDQHRAAVREQLIQRARQDPRVSGAALVGSAARGESDRWSDIDLALRLTAGADRETTADDWTHWLRSILTVADTLDVRVGETLYRVFFSTDTLQIDLSFFPFEDFRATGGEALKLLFGEARPPAPTTEPDWQMMVRWSWLYALHARSAIARRRHLQADVMLGELRAQVIALACARAGLPTHQGRGAHHLLSEISTRIIASRAADLGGVEQTRSLHAVTQILIDEVKHLDAQYASQLEPALRNLSDFTTPSD